MILLYSWKLFPNSARSYWLLINFEVRWHLTMKLFPAKISQLSPAGNAAKSMTWEGNSTVNKDDRGLVNFQLQNFQLFNKSLKDWSFGKQLILFPSNLNVSLDSASGYIEKVGKQNQLFPWGPVIKYLMFAWIDEIPRGLSWRLGVDCTSYVRQRHFCFSSG